MEVIKLYIEGFRGPWGWINEFEEYVSTHDCGLQISQLEDCDILFQCDPSNWKNNEKHLGNKFVISNVLDFADWLGGNNNTEEYVDIFCRNSNVVTAISNRVIEQLDSRHIKAKMFHYPSQVTSEIMSATNRFKTSKKNRLISFCRLGDSGKAIDESVYAFLNSELSGWEYWLIGPESPDSSLIKSINGKSVIFKGWNQNPISLFRDVAMSKATLMPSIGEGLGLPAIESLLVGTIPIVRNVEPMVSILNNTGTRFFYDFHELINEINLISECEYVIDKNPIMSWRRDVAFELFVKLLLESV